MDLCFQTRLCTSVWSAMRGSQPCDVEFWGVMRIGDAAQQLAVRIVWKPFSVQYSVPWACKPLLSCCKRRRAPMCGGTWSASAENIGCDGSGRAHFHG